MCKNKNMKTFDDLVFDKHPIAIDTIPDYKDAKQAVLNFDNGYGVSVLLGKCFYSNGVDTYELAVLKDDRICYTTSITDDVIGHISSKEVTDIMIKVQQLEK